MTDLGDLLSAAEDGVARAHGAGAPDDVLAVTRLRVRRRRVVRHAREGALGAVATLAIGWAVWAHPAPQVGPAVPTPTGSTAPTPTTAPSPAPTPSATPTVTTRTPTVQVAGLPMLVQATEDDLTGAAPGTGLALWSEQPQEPSFLLVGATGPMHLLLVEPDGDVLYLTPVPAGWSQVRDWQRGATTAVLHRQADQEEHLAEVDLLSGEVRGEVLADAWQGALDPWSVPGAISPDGAAYVDLDQQDLTVVRDGATVVLQVQGYYCLAVGWSDDTHVLVRCIDRQPEGAAPTSADGVTLHLVDARTGAVVESRALGDGEAYPTQVGVLTEDGTVVTATGTVGVEPPDRTSVCGTALTAFDGLDAVRTVREGAAADVSWPALGATGRTLLVEGGEGCPSEMSLSSLQAVDLASGALTAVLPRSTAPDGPVGLFDWQRAVD